MLKTKLLKSVNDFIIGVLLLALGIYVLVTDDIVIGNVVTGAGGFFVRPDVYVRLIGGLMAFFSLIMIIKSFNFKRAAETSAFHFAISREVILTIVALIVYAFLLSLIGFAISTFLLTFFLAAIFIRKERSGDGKPPMTKKEIIKELIIVTIYSAILDVVVYLIFSKVLHVALP